MVVRLSLAHETASRRGESFHSTGDLGMSASGQCPNVRSWRLSLSRGENDGPCGTEPAATAISAASVPRRSNALRCEARLCPRHRGLSKGPYAKMPKRPRFDQACSACAQPRPGCLRANDHGPHHFALFGELRPDTCDLCRIGLGDRITTAATTGCIAIMV